MRECVNEERSLVANWQRARCEVVLALSIHPNLLLLDVQICTGEGALKG